MPTRSQDVQWVSLRGMTYPSGHAVTNTYDVARVTIPNGRVTGNSKAFGQRSGSGDDSPTVDARLSRDGWRVVQDGEAIEHGIGASFWVEFNPPDRVVQAASSVAQIRATKHIQGLHQ